MDTRIERDCRILFTGDTWCHAARGVGATLEARLRLGSPSLPWRFWHQGDASVGARQLLDEAALRLLGRDAHRILVSVGHAPTDLEASPAVLADLPRLVELLADKRPEQAWLLLPAPSLWPEARRTACLRIRAALSEGFPRLRRLDPEPAVAAFLQAQDPDHAAALVQPDGSPTVLGAQLVADAILQAWEG